MTIERISYPQTYSRRPSSVVRRTVGFAALVIAGSAAGFAAGRNTAADLPYNGLTVTTAADGRQLSFAVVDTSLAKGQRLFGGTVDCAISGDVVSIDEPRYMPITEAQLEAFKAGATRVCDNDTAILFESQLIVTRALIESGVLSQAVEARRVQLGK